MRKVLITAVTGVCLCYGLLWILKSTPAALDHAASAGLIWEECWFPTPTFTAVHCGYLHVDHETQVAAVVIRRSLFARDIQPLLYVNGGPGATTIPQDGNIESWVGWLQDLHLDRDLVLFDFLGTGRSNPAYTCPQFIQAGLPVLATSLSADEEAEIYDRIARDCFQDLTAKKADLSKLTLPYTIKYVSQLLQTLPDVSWDIYGASYGTRVVLGLMQQPPPNIRAVVLDSVLPPDVDGYYLWPRLLEDALHSLFASCTYDDACKQRFPNLKSEFYVLVKTLDSQPLHYQVKDVSTGKPIPVVINGQRLLALVYQSMYRWDFIRKLPLALWAAQHGNPEPLQPMVEYLSLYYSVDALNDVVFLSSSCADRRPGITKEHMRKEASLYPQLQEYLIPIWKYDVCEYWTVPGVGDTYFHPVQSPLPTLLLAGELDPVTPSIWAKRVHSTLHTSFLFVAPGVGHGVVDSDRCAQTAMRTFLNERGAYKGVPCSKQLRGPRFITGLQSDQGS